MNRSITSLCARYAPLFFCVSLLAAASPVAQDDPDEAAAEFRREVRAGDLEHRKAAIADLITGAGKEALGHLLAAYVRAHREAEDAQSTYERLDINLRARKRVVADLELRSQRDESLESVVGKQQRDLKFKEVDLKAAGKDRDLARDWSLHLAQAIDNQLDEQSSSARGRVERDMWKDLEKSTETSLRLPAAELLGRIGASGAALRLQKALAKVEGERLKAQKKLPRAEKEAREFEVQLQASAAATGGRINNGLMADYDRVRQDAAQLRALITGANRVVEACADAAAVALAREEGEGKVKALAGLEKALGKSDGVVRQLTLRILASSGGEPMREKLRGLLAEESDPAVAAQLIDDLCAMDDQALAPILIESYMQAENWHVAARAIAGLATLRSKESIGVMIAMLETAEGRTKTDLQRALRSLTGKRFRTAVLWQRWWKDEGPAFEVPSAEEEAAQAEAERSEQGGTGSFFGVETDSKSVLFVVDLSGSMNASMISRSGFGDDKLDEPRRGELSRLQVAKNELKRAIASLDDGTLFNIVPYASSAWTWKKDLVEMTPDIRGEVQGFIDGLQAVGGTNIYGALSEAFRLAQIDPSGEWSEPAVDTVFLLSDGQPSLGTSSDPDTILSMVKEFNEGAGIVIHTVGLSGSQDAYLMRNLAESNGGIYTAQ